MSSNGKLVSLPELVDAGRRHDLPVTRDAVHDAVRVGELKAATAAPGPIMFDQAEANRWLLSFTSDGCQERRSPTTNASRTRSLGR